MAPPRRQRGRRGRQDAWRARPNGVLVVVAALAGARISAQAEPDARAELPRLRARVRARRLGARDTAGVVASADAAAAALF